MVVKWHWDVRFLTNLQSPRRAVDLAQRKRTLRTTPTDQNSRTALGLDERSGTRERTRLHGSRGSKGRVCSVRASVLPCFRASVLPCFRASVLARSLARLLGSSDCRLVCLRVRDGRAAGGRAGGRAWVGR